MIYRRRRCCPAGRLLLAYGFSLAACVRPPLVLAVTENGARAAEEFRFDPASGTIAVPVVFQGRMLRFLVDTGTYYTVVDSALEPELGKVLRKEPVQTLHGLLEAQFFGPLDARLGSMELEEAGDVFSCELSAWQAVGGVRIDGVLGLAFLGSHVLQVDFGLARVRFLESEGRTHPEWGAAFPVLFTRKGRAQVAASLDGTGPWPFTLDTGMAGDVMLPTVVFNGLTEEHDAPVAETLMVSAGGDTSRACLVRAGVLQIGQLRYEGLLFMSGSWPALGYDFLARHVVTFDFPNGRLYLKRRPDWNRPSEADMSGLHLLRTEGQTVVHSVDEVSPAANAGITAEDVILRIGAAPASEMQMWEIRRFLKSADGRKIDMRIRRGEEEIDVSFRLKRRL